MQLSEQDAREFEQFWSAYPRKTAKGDARKAWMQTRAIRPPINIVIERVKGYMAWREDLARRREFVPALAYPATWLRGERWADAFDTPAEKAWHETSTGIEAKGRDLGIDRERFPHFPAFKAAVFAAVKAAERGGNVVPLARRA